MLDRAQVKNAIDAGGGMLRLEPSWVPRSFMIPGERLKLHPRDVYALGGHRGGINERWFSSTTNADNGPGTPADEGLSYVRLDNGSRFLLKDAVDTAGDLLLGSVVMEREKGWNLLCKFFDNMGPIPHHMHQTDAQAKLLGRKGKPARCFPKPAKPFEQTERDGYREDSAKELTVLPKQTITIKDAAAYGIILTQGYGRFGTLPVSTPSMIRFGQMTEDELFVTEPAALQGIKIENLSATDPLVILKHFGPGNPEAEGLKRKS